MSFPKGEGADTSCAFSARRRFQAPAFPSLAQGSSNESRSPALFWIEGTNGADGGLESMPQRASSFVALLRFLAEGHSEALEMVA
jgi:hypothetical protein